MAPLYISNKRRLTEISAVVLTAVGKFVFMDYLNWRFLFVVAATTFWVIYIFSRNRTEPGIVKYWGFRTDNFKKALRIVFPLGLLSVVAFICVGLYQQTINITWHIIPILILYPIWGVIQQFLLIALTAGNMQDIKGYSLNRTVIILFPALLFALVHYPFIWLIVATFLLAIFYGFVYLNERNIYVLGLFHGWLGGIFYYTVLDRDPFLEMFGKLLRSSN
jgi:uncharacterized protein